MAIREAVKGIQKRRRKTTSFKTDAYTPTQLKPVGPNMGKVNKVKGNIGKVQQVTQDTIYGGMQDNKDYKFTQNTVKKPTTKKKPSTKKKSRGLVTMTSMQNKYL